MRGWTASLYLDHTTRDIEEDRATPWNAWAQRIRDFRPTDRFGLLTLALVTLVAASQLFWGGTVIGQDSATQFYPWYDFLGERLLAGELPGWNPYQFAGVPFAADPQSGWMYLPAMLIFTVLPLAYAAPVFIVFHIALAGVGTYVLGRLLGLGVGGALVAGVAYQLAPPIYGRSVCCPAQYEIGAWMPIAIVGAELAMRGRTWEWRVIGWSITGLAMSQAMSAWLGQGGYYFLMVLAAFIAYRGLIAPGDLHAGWRRRVGDTLLHGLTMLAIGFGLAAAGILPRLEYIGRSNVAGGEYGGDSSWASQIGGVTPGMIVDRLLNPTLYYPGAAVLVLALAAAVLARRNRAIPFFAGLGVCAIILATPWKTPLHLLLYAAMPMFEQLHQHWPDRVAIVAYLCFAIPAGAAVEALATRRIGGRSALLAVGIPSLILLALPLFNADVPVMPIVAVGLTLGIVAMTVMARTAWIRPAVPALLAAVVALDLIVAFHGATAQGPYGGFHRRNLEEYYAPSGAAVFLQERMAEQPGRYIGFDPEQRAVADGQLVLYRYQFASPDTAALLVNNRGVLHGVEDAQGYNPVQPARFVDYLTALNGHPQEYHDANIYPTGLDSPLLDLLDIRYIVMPTTYAEDRDDLRDLDRTFPTIYADDQVQVLENPNALPRAWIVHDARQVATDEVLPMLATGAVDPHETALLESPPPQLETPLDGSSSSVRFLKDEPELLRLESDAAEPGLLMLSETYDPNWRAYVDGEEVEISTANYLFRAVPVPAGEHIVELRYEPVTLRVGMGVSAATLAIVIPALAWSVWRLRDPRDGMDMTARSWQV